MLNVKIDGTHHLSLEEKAEGLMVDGVLAAKEVIAIGPTTFKVVGEKSISEVELVDVSDKTISLTINNRPIKLDVADHIDQILTKLGMDSSQQKSIKETKAPMPGTILEVMISEGDHVQAGDAMVVLEAMKMENVIKSVGDGIVSKVHVAPGQNVEKNQVLISFS